MRRIAFACLALLGCAAGADDDPEAHAAHGDVFPATGAQPGDVFVKSTDYPDAAFLPARWFTRGRTEALDRVVIHTTESGYDGALSWFRDPRNPYHTSAHYVVRSRDGAVTQMVREADTAHHARGTNARSIGVHVEARASEARWFTDAMLRSTARLVRDVCRRNGIPMDRAHIVGHDELGTGNTDPGRHWDWDAFLRLVREDDVAVCDEGVGACAGDIWTACAGGRLVSTNCAPGGGRCVAGAGCVGPEAPAGCGDLDRAGRCDGEVAVWCDAGQVKRRDCAAEGAACRFVDDATGYYCARPEAPPAAVSVPWTPRGRCEPAVADPFLPADTGGPDGESISACARRVRAGRLNTTDCRSLPTAEGWLLTTFGGPGDQQPVACGGPRADGRWYYAANSQRFGCGTRVRLETDRGCVVVATVDVGPHVCIEERAGAPVFDVSPLAARVLVGRPDVGWSEREAIRATVVDAATPLGPCR